MTVAFVALHLAPLGISDERRSLKTIDVRFVQVVNAPLPMLDTVFSIVAVFNSLHEANALDKMSVVPLGIYKFVNDLHAPNE